MVPSNTATPQVVTTPWGLVNQAASSTTESYICQSRSLLGYSKIFSESSQSFEGIPIISNG